MPLDNRKGVEEQARKLFGVCRKRRLPIFTFVNKCDRPGTDPFGLRDDVERDLGIECFPAVWPLRRGDRLIGVFDRLDRGALQVGDTISTVARLEYPGVPRFSPEYFASVRLGDPLRRKHLARGL